jgi:hypothetical protein
MGRCLVNLTYVNEGDKFLSPFVFDQVLAAQVTLGQVLGIEGVYLAPNLTAVTVASFLGDAPGATAFIRATQLKGRPVFDKFSQLFIGPTAKRTEFMNLMKFFRLVQPVKVAHATQVSLFDDISIVLTIPPLTPLHDALLRELPLYIVAAAGVEADVDLLVWWRTHRTKLPTWYTVCRAAVLAAPSSAAAERVFAMLKWMFSDQQQTLLEDLKEGAMMGRYNRYM